MIIRDLFKLFGTGMKAYAYVKMCQKTGLTPTELDLWKDVSKQGTRIVGKKINIWLVEKGVIKARKPKVKKIKINSKGMFQDKSTHNTPEQKAKIKLSTMEKLDILLH